MPDHPARVNTVLGGTQKGIGTLMLKSIYEGYIPIALLAIIGHGYYGGSVLFWLAFVWIFGAVATVAVGYLRTKMVPAHGTAQNVPAVIENC